MDIKNIVIDESMTIRNAMMKLDETSRRILLVVNRDNYLDGVVTDGDIRRWILKNGNLNNSVKDIMSKDPITINLNDVEQATEFMKRRFLDAVPVVDTDRKLIDVKFLNDTQIINNNIIGNIPVIIMAGGKGTRLYPYTRILPKPLVPIGEIPIVERIMDRFSRFGVRTFFMTVNYKKSMIKSYFSEIKKEYSLKFVDEEIPLGTAGSLELVKNHIDDTFFVSNCDILVEADYNEIYKHHRDSGNIITVVSSMKHVKIPYGVIEVNEGGQIKETIEKPEYNLLVNTGFYVLEREVMDYIAKNEFLNMTDLVDDMIERKMKVGIYPISENSWLDMGELDAMNHMVKQVEKKGE
jgi:dTDP-glucose pyrophosphorylase/CBS domain-containing protein